MAEEKKKKVKTPTAEKRILQSEKKRLRNRSFKSQLTTALRSFTESLKNKDEKENASQNLKTVCYLMDKGVKKGLFHKKTLIAILKYDIPIKDFNNICDI